ncbi:MAG: transposase [Halopseudomonas sp.]|uniref:REP-associated tyrosine transposase n=1 Tax=Halopseudomonas sp. TaxID=2901191 RepID=UPI0030038518
MDHDEEHRGWYVARRLPHFDTAGTLQFVSFRLADSLPAQVLAAFEHELQELPRSARTIAMRARIESYLDQGYGCCLLARPEMAATLCQAFNHYHDRRYRLLAWCIMPNHVHILIEPQASLPRIVQAWKSWSARWAFQHAAELKLDMPQNGFWMHGYWDRYIRDEAHFHAAVSYIHENPVKAGLCKVASDWAWSSASAKLNPAVCGLKSDGRGNAERPVRPWPV